MHAGLQQCMGGSAVVVYQGIMHCRKLKMPRMMYPNCIAAYGINTGFRTRLVWMFVCGLRYRSITLVKKSSSKPKPIAKQDNTWTEMFWYFCMKFCSGKCQVSVFGT